MAEVIDVVKYSRRRKEDWEGFLRTSKNGLFLFSRDYMEYHADKFADFSLVIYDENKLIALFPANVQEKLLLSHGGLTFGGFVVDSRMTVPRMLRVVDALMGYLQAELVQKVIYKCIPYIYSSIPSEEDRYALFRNDARLLRRDVTSAIYLPERIHFRELRLRSIKKAQSANLEVRQTQDLALFWSILQANLSTRHHTQPVHSLDEIKGLQRRFPANIKFFGAYRKDELLGGTVVYESPNVAHAQYIACSEEGRQLCCLDLLFSCLINDYYMDKKFFDFGISTEQNGAYLNEGLISFKEGFGARAVCHDFYELNL